jgi:hypothetical protein
VAKNSRPSLWPRQTVSRKESAPRPETGFDERLRPVQSCGVNFTGRESCYQRLCTMIALLDQLAPSRIVRRGPGVTLGPRCPIPADDARSARRRDLAYSVSFRQPDTSRRYQGSLGSVPENSPYQSVKSSPVSPRQQSGPPTRGFHTAWTQFISDYLGRQRRPSAKRRKKSSRKDRWQMHEDSHYVIR